MSIGKKMVGKKARYFARVYVAQDPVTKKRIYKEGSYRNLKREAEEDEIEIKRLAKSLKKNILKQANLDFRMTVAELIPQFYKSRYYKNLSERTKDDYQYYINREMIPHWGKKAVKQIDYLDVQNWVDSMEKKWSPATLHKPFTQFREIMRFAVRSRIIPYNPCAEVELPTISTGQGLRMTTTDSPSVWTADQVNSFLNWPDLKTSKYYAMILISFSTALRPGEVCGLWRDSLDGDILRIQNGLDTKCRVTDLKNKRSHREVCISQNVIHAINRHLAWQSRCKLILQHDYIDDNHMFRHETGSPIRPDVYNRNFRKLIINYNETHAENPLPLIPIYKVRHTWATIADERNIDSKVIAAIMGHSSTHTASQNYISIKPDRIREATSI